ncbi:MAG: hypothetical protein HFH85_10350 [Lachnospiraceae bacterium]|jgi:hypothetical protein|nr:hypothetical protein [Lachnospiraceae bacterium]
MAMEEMQKGVKMEIMVVEDSVRHAEAIVESYKEAIDKIKQKGLLEKLGPLDVEITWLQGKKADSMRNNEKYLFYDENICVEIAKNIDQNTKKGIRTGILLDVALSREEYDKASVNDYSGFKIAREIYEKFHDNAGIYIVTSIREFSSQILSLMGTRDLVQRYISKALVTEYPSCGAIGRTIGFMYDERILEEEVEDELDELM